MPRVNMANGPAVAASIDLGTRGARLALVSACASGAEALARAQVRAMRLAMA
jgi:3-oxoacyl-(acyl-carrier-protein) synthase